MRKKNVALIIFALLSVCSGKTNGSLSFDFTRIQTRASGADTTQGTLYQFGNRMVIKVTAPIAQFMIIDSSSTLIYNCGERSAIQFRSNSSAAMPLFQVFFKLYQGNQLLPPSPFKQGTTQKSGDTLHSTWILETKKKTSPVRFESVYYKDEPVMEGLYDAKGMCISLLQFSKDTLINGRHVPLRISSSVPQGSLMLIETVSICHLLTNANVPEEILHFKLPPEIPVKVIEW